MTIGLLTDAAERFVLGTRNGVLKPTDEAITDTAVTPFGLTLRTAPLRRNVVRVRSVDGVITMGTDQITLIESDGNGEGSDTQVDYNVD